jgi:7,8-dihydropterin-6-yl-methyl-4-(beta-D-ribofuranosyl)aminobenzene 5'-phosphate synthase
MTITSLIDDYCPKRIFRGEHGLSLLIETASAKILFDTGQSSAFLANAAALGIDLDTIDAIVLSHGHYDHSGGLSALLQKDRPERVPLYAGKGFSESRYSKVAGKLNDIGLEPEIATIAEKRACIVEGIREIAAGIFVMSRAENTERASPRFWKLHEGEEMPDEFEDELSLVVQESKGIVLITGCAHRGIVTIARSATNAFPNMPLKALVGGFHLVDASSEAIASTIRGIEALNPGALYCSHCTGLSGFAALHNALPGKVGWLSCGMQIII